MSDRIATLTSKDDISIITLDDGKANVFSPKIKTLDEKYKQNPELRTIVMWRYSFLAVFFPGSEI